MGEKFFVKNMERFCEYKMCECFVRKNLANSSANHERKKQETLTEKVNIKNVCGSGGKENVECVRTKY